MSDHTAHPLLPPVIPHFGRKDYRPQVGDRLNVFLPGESTTGIIDDVMSDNAVTVILDGVMMGKVHPYKKGDRVGVRREIAPVIGNEIWVVQSQRVLDAAAEAEYFARAERRRIEEEKEAASRSAVEAKLPPRAPPPVEPAAKRAVLGPRRNRVRA